MSFQAGNIKYDIEVSTVDLLKAEAIVDKSLEKQTQSFVQADKAVRDYEKTQRDLGRTIGQTGIVFNKNGKVLVEQTNQYRALTAQAMSTHENLTALGGGVSRLADGVRRGNIDMTNMSYQLQDIAVQAQMGINPFMIASQQIPQLLVGMGAAAAGIGAAVAVLGGLALAFIDTSTNAEKLEKSIERVQAVITLGVGGVANYTEQMQRMSEVSERLTKIKLALAMAEQKDALKLAVKEMKDSIDSTRGKFESFDTQMENLFNLKRGQKGFNEARQALIDFNMELSLISRGKGDIDALEESLTNLNQYAINTKDGKEALQRLVDAIFKFREGQSTLEALNEAIADTGSIVAETSSDFDRLSESMRMQIIELERGKRAALEFSLSQTDMTEAQRQAILSDFDRIESLKSLGDEIERVNREVEWFNDEMEALDLADKNKKITLEKQVQGIGLTDEEAIRARYATETDLLRQAEEAGIQIKGEYSERYKELKRQENEELKGLVDEQEDWFTKSMEAMENQAIGAFTQFVTGAKSGKEAIHDLAKSILTQMIGAIVKQGIAAITTSNTTTAAISANNTTIAASAAPAAASMSLATAGGNSVGAISGIAATSAAMLALMAIGGRESGGAVSAGSMYRVGEKGPEMFRTRSGQNYMIPGESGQVINNRNSFGGGVGGGVNWTIQVNNNAPARAYATVDDVNRIVKVEVSDLSNQVQNNAGPFYRSLTQATNVRGRNG